MSAKRLFGYPVREQHSPQIRTKALVRGYVLAGGASSRFGQDKALAPLSGKPALARMLEVLGQSVVRETLVIGKRSSYGHLGPRCIPDKWPGEGPLGGIITALRSSGRSKYGYRWNLIISCDMPFLTKEWLGYLCQRAAQSDAEVIVPRSAKGLEPLCACWHTYAFPTLEKAFERGARRVSEGIALLRAEVLDESVWKRFDTAGRLFWNMNTPTEYEEARRILESEPG